MESALTEPLYEVTPAEGSVKQRWNCVLCPGKELKTERIRDKHCDSGVSSSFRSFAVCGPWVRQALEHICSGASFST